MNIRQIVAKNTILQIVLTLFNLLAGLYSISLIAKYLGEITFGKYGFISSFYFFFIAILDFGIVTVAIREIAKDRRNAGFLLSNVVTFRVLLSILLTFVAIIIANTFPFPNDLRLALSLYAPVLLFIALESIQAIFEADLQYEYIALSAFFWRVSSLLFLIFAVRLNLGLSFIVLSFLLAEAIKFIILFLSAKRNIDIKLPTFDIKLWREMIKKALPIGITSLFIASIRNIDVVILTKIRGFAETGLYLAPYRLCDMSLSLPIALIVSIFPLMSIFYKEDFNILKRIHQKTFDILSICAVLIVVLVLVLSEGIILKLFGYAFIRSAPAFRILIFYAVLVYLVICSGTLLIVMDMQRISMWIYLLSALLNLLLNLLLIPHLGSQGAAISKVAAMFLLAFLTFYIVRTKVKISLETRRIKKALVAGLVTLVALHYLRGLDLFISIPVGILLYIFLVICIKAIDINDILYLLNRKLIQDK